MDFSIISRIKAQQRVLKSTVNCEIYTENHLRDLNIAEYLRKSLCHLSNTQKSHFQPIYVTRLLNSVRGQLCPLWPEISLNHDNSSIMIEPQPKNDDEDFLRRILNYLETIGDVMEVGKGYWLPTPVRLIQSPLPDKVLVVGGLATVDLSVALETIVKNLGFVRFLERSKLPKSIIIDQSRWQAYQDWSGENPEDLAGWTKRVIKQAKSNLRPSASDFDNFDIYVPSQQMDSRQYRRWVSFSNFKQGAIKLNHDLMLCRVKSNYGYNYCFGMIDSNGLTKEVAIEDCSLPRRLMYGMDLLNDSPTQAVWEPGCIIRLSNWPPNDELRLFIALGIDVSPNPGKLPLRFMFQEEWQEVITRVLNKLGIAVEGENNDG